MNSALLPSDRIQPAVKPQLITTPAGTLDHLAVVRLIAKVMDTAFVVPGTKFRIGLDAVIGLFPVVGDAVGAILGSYILVTAARLGVPKTVLMRMLANIGTDAVVGSVPMVGDVLDAAWRANAKNAALLEQALKNPLETKRRSRWMLAGLVAAVVGMVAAGVTLTVLLVRWLWLATG